MFKPNYLLILAVILCPKLASANKEQNFPEAFLGLEDNAYQLIDIQQNKSNTLVFEVNGNKVNIELSNNKSIPAQDLNQSFTHQIPGGYITATRGQDSLFGQMHLAGNHYILTTNETGIWAVELPSSGLNFNDCGFDHQSQLTQSPKQQTNKAAGTIIDLLVIYDQAIKDRYPGALLDTRIDQYVHITNQTLANSDIDLAIRLVGSELTGYNFNDANNNVLDQMQQTLASGIGSQGLEQLPSWVEENKPDLVIFMRTMNIEKRGNCGVAYYPVSDENGVFDPSYGVNVIADGMSSWSICTDQLMAHEIGHNLGAGHHNTSPENRVLPDSAGFAKLGQYGTVMGSFGTGQPDRFLELNYFSNPNVTCGGSPCGVAGQANNANVINTLKSTVASYRNSNSTAPLPDDLSTALIDSDDDGKLDRDDAFPFNVIEFVDSDGDGVGDVTDQFPSTPSEQFDFDGDGLGDVADNDDDGDGVPDLADAFPYNSNESSDSDQDGVGDASDAFIFEASESSDPDLDGIGDHIDNDDDNDGVIDLSETQQDVLVISVGNNRILRFDAQSGLPKGIEVLPSDGLLTFQSDLTYDADIQQLFYSTASSIKSLDMMDLQATPQLMLSAYGGGNTKLNTGFPTAIATNGNRGLLTAKLRATQLDVYSYTNFDKPVQGFFSPFERADEENIIDIKMHQNSIYLLGQNNRAYKTNSNGTVFELIGNGNKPWLVDPYAFVVTDDEIFLHTDQARNKVLMTDSETGNYEGIFTDLAELGYSNPTGIELTNDGRVLVAVSDQNTILQFDVGSGDFMGELVKDLGLDQPHHMVLVPQLQDRFHQKSNQVIQPNAGNWFNPETSGRGFNIGIFDNRLQVLWFTYDETGAPIWYTSAGDLSGFNYSTDLLKTKLNPDNSVSVTDIGEIKLQFENERTALMQWQIGADSGEETIQWLQFSGEPETVNYTGMWTRPDSPGWGTAVITNGDKTVMIPFIYDQTGEPRWVISEVKQGVQPFTMNMNAVFSNTLCPTCSGEAITNISPAGTMFTDLSAQPYWDSEIVWPAPLAGNWQLQQTELVRISSFPSKPR